jgi:hypothetical protein
MKGFNYRVASLAAWLEIATKGIAAAGRERITREIEAHFAEAVEAHLAQGETEEAAKADALGELGDAKTARGRFRKRHLTEREAKGLVNSRKIASSKRRLALNIGSGLILTFVALGMNPKSVFLFCVPIFLGLVVLPFFAFLSSRKPGNKSKLSSMLLFEAVQFASSIWPIIFLLSLCRSKSMLVFITTLLTWDVLLCVAGLIDSFRIWRKIRKYEKPAIGN